MRVMRVASCCELRVTASCCELLQTTFLRAFLPLLLLLLYCYLLITASFGSPEASLAPRLRTFFVFLMRVFSGFLYFMDHGSLDQGRMDHGS